MIDNPQTDRRERYAAPLYALMRQNGWDGERTEPVVREMDLVLDAVIAVADAELAARRAADLRDAEEICDEAGASYTAKALNEQADGAYGLMERFRRKAEEAEQTAATVPVPPTTHATVPAEAVCKFEEGCHRVVACAPGCGTPWPTDRASVLREAADVAARWNSDCQNCAVELEVAGELRRLAAETPQSATEKPWMSDGSRIGRALIWSWSDAGHGEFARGYRAAQEEARALLTGPGGTDASRAVERPECRMADEAQQQKPELGADPIEDYLKFLRGQGSKPDLSGLPAEHRAAIMGQFEIVKALADRDPSLPPLDRDPVARRLGLHQAADEAQQPVCAECGHPHAAHREGDDPVTPGTCAGCGDDDRHDYVAGAQQQGDTETQAPDEDPARIDRLRPEFTEHSSVEAIDAQLRRSRSQQRRWHLRTEWLISLRQRRVKQQARGEWPVPGPGRVADEGQP